jgi:hypothetical protein
MKAAFNEEVPGGLDYLLASRRDIALGFAQVLGSGRDFLRDLLVSAQQSDSKYD